MKAKIQAILASLKNEIIDTWERSKIYILAVLGIIGALEFRKISMWLVAYFGKKELESAQKTDQKMQAVESQENQQANQLVKQADALTSQEQTVTDDWYRNN